MGVVIVTAASLGGVTGFAEVQSQNVSSAPSQQNQTSAPSDGIQPGPAPSAGSSNGRSDESAGQVGARLHDSAKSFGEALLGGIKYIGHTVIGFFTPDKSTGDKSK